MSMSELRSVRAALERNSMLLNRVLAHLEPTGVEDPVVRHCSWCPVPFAPQRRFHPDGGPEHREVPS